MMSIVEETTAFINWKYLIVGINFVIGLPLVPENIGVKFDVKLNQWLLLHVFFEY